MKLVGFERTCQALISQYPTVPVHVSYVGQWCWVIDTSLLAAVPWVRLRTPVFDIKNHHDIKDHCTPMFKIPEHVMHKTDIATRPSMAIVGKTSVPIWSLNTCALLTYMSRDIDSMFDLHAGKQPR